MAAAKHKDLNARVKDFVGRRKTMIDRDTEDLKESRAFSSGFGFSERDREIRGNSKNTSSRAETTTNVTRPWYNSVISAYNANPFTIGVRRYDGGDTFGVSSIIDYQVIKSDLADVASQVLEDVLNDGYGYFLVDTAYDNPSAQTQYAKSVHLDNGRVFFDDCDSPTGADCQMAVYIDLILKETATEKYDISKRELSRNSDPFAEIDYIGKNSNDYTSIATIYEVTSQGCEVSTMVHGQQVGKTVLFPGLSRLPIVRCAAEKIFLESEEQWTYRGAYWFVYSLVKKINYEMSSQTESVATKPLTKFLAPKGSFTGLSDQLSSVNKDPRLYIEYNAIDPATGNPIPAPTPYGENAIQTGLMDDVEKTNALVASILGNPTAESPANETAEAVLLKKGNQEATVSRFLKALKESLEEVGRVMLDMIPSLFPADRVADGKMLQAVMDVDSYYVEIDKGPMVQSQQQRSIAILMALSQIIQANPSNPAIPLIIKNSELSQEDKDALMQSLQPQQAQIPPEVQQQMAAKDQQVAQMQQAMAESQKTIAQLQQALWEMQNDSRAKVLMKQMDIEAQYNLKRMELAASNKAMQAQIVADAQSQTQKLQVELQKEVIKSRESSPDAPLFTSSKFTS